MNTSSFLNKMRLNSQHWLKTICFTTAMSLTFAQTSKAQDTDNLTIYAELNQKKKLVLRGKNGINSLIPTYVIQFQHGSEFQNGESKLDTLSLGSTGFRLRRARLQINGTLFTKQLKYETDLELQTPKTDRPAFDLKDMYFDYAVNDWLHFKFGQYKVPFSLQYLISGALQQFNERSIANRAFFADRDIGIGLWGESKKNRFRYFFGIFNGDGANHLNINQDMLYSSRFEWITIGKHYPREETDMRSTYTPRLVLGIENYFNRDISSQDFLNTSGAYGRFKYGGFSVQGEYYYRLNFNDTTAELNRQDIHGFYFQSGYHWIPKTLETIVRASTIFRKTKHPAQEYAVALNYYFRGQNLKLVTDYTLKLNENFDQEMKHRVLSQMQLMF